MKILPVFCSIISVVVLSFIFTVEIGKFFFFFELSAECEFFFTTVIFWLAK